MVKKCFFCGSSDVVRNGVRGPLNGINARPVDAVLTEGFVEIRPRR